MKGITIGGVEYLPASALAKKFKYTSDYIGQLCRAKKIDAQLVGRSWYVNPVSLEEHKSGRYSNTKPESNIKSDSSGVSKVAIARIDVEAPVSNNTVKMSRETFKSGNFSKRMDWKPLKYEVDEADLLPSVRQEPRSAYIHLDLADSTDIPIKLASKPTKMVADPLPEISLKGKLKVASLDEVEIENFFDDSSDDFPTESVVELRREEYPSTRTALHHSLPTKAALKRPTSMSSRPKENFLPEISFTPESQQQVPDEEVGFEYVRVTLITTTGLLVALLMLVFFGESSVSATTSTYTSGLDFSTQSLSALVTLFSN
jgi:hypothetical protein